MAHNSQNSPNFQQKYREAEAKIVQKIGTEQWECQLYVPLFFPILSLAHIYFTMQSKRYSVYSTSHAHIWKCLCTKRG